MIHYQPHPWSPWGTRQRQYRWTDEEIATLRQLSKHYSLSMVAKLMGLKKDRVRHKCNALGIKIEKSWHYHHWTEADDHVLKKMAGTYPAKTIANHFNVSLASLRVFAHKRGISLRLYGEKAPRAKHKDVDVERCRRLKDDGLNVKAIAVSTGINPYTVSGFVYYEVRLNDGFVIL